MKKTKEKESEDEAWTCERKKRWQRKISKNHIGSYFIDFIFFIILLAFLLLDVFIFRKEGGYENIATPSAVIITLLPCVISVISIVLSLGKEKVYGVTYKEILNSLTGFWYFTFFHTLITSCVVIGIFSMLFVLKLNITIICLEVLSLIYCLIFTCQNIPPLIQSRNFIKKKLSKNYQKSPGGDGIFKNLETGVFNTLISEITLKEGIEVAFNILSKRTDEKKETEALDYLLSMQNEFFWGVLERCPSNGLGKLEPYQNIFAIDAIDMGYRNIDKFISDDSEDCLGVKLGKNKYYQITRCVFSLHDLCRIYGLEQKEETEMIPMIDFSPIHSILNKKNELGVASIICMLATTLNDGDTWFVKFLRDNHLYPSAIFDFSSCPIGFFVSMIIGHLFSRSLLAKGKRNNIETFISEETEGLNADGSSWKILLNRSVEFGKGKDIVESINQLLRYYDSVDESVFYFDGGKKKVSMDCRDSFTKQDLFHDWLLLVFAKAYNDSEQLDFEETLRTLKDRDKGVLSEELSQNWLSEGKIKDDIDFSFLKLFDVDFENPALIDGIFDEMTKQLVEFHDNFFKSKTEKTVSQESLDKWKSKVIQKANEAIKENVLCDSGLGTKNQKEMCFRFTIRSKDWEQILLRYLDRLPMSFMGVVNKSLEEKFGDIKRQKELITSDFLMKLVDFKAQYASSDYWIRLYLMDEENKYGRSLRDLNVKKVSGVDPGFYWKEGAIRFNATIDEDATVVRSLNESEIEQTIEREYSPFDNGLYRFSDVEGDKQHDYYLTKEELVERLKKMIVYVCIVFRSVVSIDENGILRAEE